MFKTLWLAEKRSRASLQKHIFLSNPEMLERPAKKTGRSPQRKGAEVSGSFPSRTGFSTTTQIWFIHAIRTCFTMVNVTFGYSVFNKPNMIGFFLIERLDFVEKVSLVNAHLKADARFSPERFCFLLYQAPSIGAFSSAISSSSSSNTSSAAEDLFVRFCSYYWQSGVLFPVSHPPCRSTPGSRWAPARSAAVAEASGTPDASPLVLALWQILWQEF